MIFVLFSMPLLSQEVVAPAGNYHESGNRSISWTLGDVVIETFSAANRQLTQGFQQGDLVVSTLARDVFGDLNIRVFPNPARDLVTLSVDTELQDKVDYMLFSMDGRLIDRQAVKDRETGIPFEHLERGVYFIRVMRGFHLLATFRVVKY